MDTVSIAVARLTKRYSCSFDEVSFEKDMEDWRKNSKNEAISYMPISLPEEENNAEISKRP